MKDKSEYRSSRLNLDPAVAAMIGEGGGCYRDLEAEERERLIELGQWVQRPDQPPPCVELPSTCPMPG